MTYLLDVNVLIALGHAAHEHHGRALAWFRSLPTSATSLGTCALTELGFVRVSVQIGLQSDVAAARRALGALKASSRIRFELLPDALGADTLPAFARTSRNLADGHLVVLAAFHGARLATFDTRIPGSMLLP